MFHSPGLTSTHLISTTVHRRTSQRSRIRFSFLLFLFSFTFANSALAQIDTTLREYFPMHVGDYWEYAEFSGDRFSCRIIGDTVLNNGKRYYTFRFNNGDSWFYRIDDSMRVFRYWGNISRCPEQEFIAYGLTREDSSVWHICIYGNAHYSYIGLVRTSLRFYPRLNLSATTKEFSGAIIDPTNGDTTFTTTYYPKYHIARGIGLIWTQGEAAPPYELVGAIVNGVIYGSISSVDLNERTTTHAIQNYPNPFNGSTRIGFSLTEKEIVSLTVVNILGEVIDVLISKKKLDAGSYEVEWSARNISSGIYFYKIDTERFTYWGKAIVLK